MHDARHPCAATTTLLFSLSHIRLLAAENWELGPHDFSTLRVSYQAYQPRVQQDPHSGIFLFSFHLAKASNPDQANCSVLVLVADLTTSYVERRRVGRQTHLLQVMYLCETPRMCHS